MMYRITILEIARIRALESSVKIDGFKMILYTLTDIILTIPWSFKDSSGNDVMAIIPELVTPSTRFLSTYEKEYFKIFLENTDRLGITRDQI
jgi:hypothetical protein